jgi:hypothetical protein
MLKGLDVTFIAEKLFWRATTQILATELKTQVFNFSLPNLELKTWIFKAFPTRPA